MTYSLGAQQLLDRLRKAAVERSMREAGTHRDVRLAREAGVSAEDIANALQVSRRSVAARCPHT